MDLHKEASRGQEAERLLANPLLVEAFQGVRNGILSGMEKSAFGDQSTHHHLVIALQLLGQIEKSLKDVAATGKMASIQLERGLIGNLRAAAGF